MCPRGLTRDWATPPGCGAAAPSGTRQTQVPCAQAGSAGRSRARNGRPREAYPRHDRSERNEAGADGFALWRGASVSGQLPRFDDAVRIGVRLLIAAVLAGLAVLVVQGRAAAADGDLERTLDVLLETPSHTPEERVRAVEALLEEDRKQRYQSAARLALEAAWKAGTRRSVGAALRGAKGMWRALQALRERSSAESDALRLLEGHVQSGVTNERLEELYAELSDRARERGARARLARVREALELGDAAQARVRLDRLREEEPAHPRVSSLEDALGALELRQAEAREALVSVRADPLPGEAALLQSLFVGNLEQVCAADAAGEDRSLACAAGLYAAGDREEALAVVARASDAGGTASSIASRWLADTRLHPEREWRRVRRLDRIRDALGWIGGPDLERCGLELSVDGLKAWRSAVSPLNLALSVPLRMVRRRERDHAEIRTLAAAYLDHHPEGPVAEEARGWLSRTEPTEAERRRASLYRDGILALPRARTLYTPVVPWPVRVSVELLRELEGDAAPALAARLPGVEAIVLDPAGPRPEQPDAIVLEPNAAGPLLEEIASALDSGRADPVEGSTDRALEALRQLDRRVREGGRLAVQPWSASLGSGGGLGFVIDALEGSRGRVGEVVVRRGGDTVEFQRSFHGETACPRRIVCLEPNHRVAGKLYGRVDVDSDPRLGLLTRMGGASLRVEVSGSGPGARLDLPIASALGVQRWIPLDTSIGIGVDGVGIAPRLGAGPSSSPH